MLWRQQRTTYSRAEWIADAVVHGVGLVLLAVAVPILLLLTALRHQKGPALAGVSVYALGLVAMFAASAAYNIVSGVRRGKAWAWLLKRLDHAAIYVKIAGTYTPFAVLTGQGWRLALVVWVGALAGVVLKLFSPDRLRWLALALDLALGWAGLVFGKELIAALPSDRPDGGWRRSLHAGRRFLPLGAAAVSSHALARGRLGGKLLFLFSGPGICGLVLRSARC